MTNLVARVLTRADIVWRVFTDSVFVMMSPSSLPTRSVGLFIRLVVPANQSLNGRHYVDAERKVCRWAGLYSNV